MVFLLFFKFHLRILLRSFLSRFIRETGLKLSFSSCVLMGDADFVFGNVYLFLFYGTLIIETVSLPPDAAFLQVSSAMLA